MQNRLRLLQAATAVLYLGPLVAGLAGRGWAMIPLFTAIFVLWSVIIRPHLWPTSLRDLAKPEAIVALAALAATQILLVALCFAIGRGAGGVMGLRLSLPFYWPAALSFVAIPLSRLVWNPEQTADLAGFDPLLHQALRTSALRPEAPAQPKVAQTMVPQTTLAESTVAQTTVAQTMVAQTTLAESTVPQSTVTPSTLAQSMVAKVLALPGDVGAADLQAHLAALAAHVDAFQIRDALEPAAGGQITRAGAKAMIVHATDPAVAGRLSGSGYPARAFTLAGPDDGLLTLFATRAARVLEDHPDLARDYPAIPALTQAAQTANPPARAALLRLADQLRQSPPADPTPH